MPSGENTNQAVLKPTGPAVTDDDDVRAPWPSSSDFRVCAW
jgi:hypothetical protein